ncbi:MAG TPA: right-handed parallel beta-helix repeat-containing protein [Pyrinomonadaceae bacterium]|jgi:hypothetical protein
MNPSTCLKRHRRLWLTGALATVALCLTLFTGGNVSANHPVFVEGNCDSPVPGTTLVTVAGTCGDYDGDGRIGTAEDTDGSDRIFGTINAALGNVDLGATINATTAGLNGRVIIVASGRYPEQITILNNAPLFPNPGNVQIEAAAGVAANIDAVLSGDPAGGNNTRQNGVGIRVETPAGRITTLRNLTIRNFAIGVEADGVSRVNIDNCNIDNNRDLGLLATSVARLTVNNTRINGTGFRVNPAVNNTPTGGHGIEFRQVSGGVISNTVISNSAGCGLSNQTTGNSTNIRIFHVILADDDAGGICSAPGAGAIVFCNTDANCP